MAEVKHRTVETNDIRYARDTESLGFDRLPGGLLCIRRPQRGPARRSDREIIVSAATQCLMFAGGPSKPSVTWRMLFAANSATVARETE